VTSPRALPLKFHSPWKGRQLCWGLLLATSDMRIYRQAVVAELCQTPELKDATPMERGSTDAPLCMDWGEGARRPWPIIGPKCLTSRRSPRAGESLPTYFVP